ncbi:MAG: hypothetical protein EPO46_10235 [Lysobacter sp.]|nr:MAG: hypothetical protein EPO46_10235 [Lysobacter sp.]
MTTIRQFEPGLYSAGQPSPEELADLAQQGVRTVINLRGTDETMGFDEAAEAARLGMDYRAVPIANASQLDRAKIDEFARELDDARQRGAVLIHCGSANRVGAAVALQEGWLRGRDAEDALDAGRAAGLTALEPVVAGLLSSHSL